MKQYHVSVDGQQPTVVAEDVLAKEAAEGKYPANTLIWCEGMAGWEPIGKHFKPSFSSRLDGVMAKVPLGKLKSLKNRFAAGGQRLKRPMSPRARKLLLILGGVGLVWIVLSIIASPSGNPEQLELETVYRDMATCIGNDDWGQLYEKFNDRLSEERYRNHYYADGTWREKVLFNDEELYNRAFRETRVVPKREPLAGAEHYRTRFETYMIENELEAVENKLSGSNLDMASQLQEMLTTRDALKKELYIRCELEDVSSTMFLISFLADGVVNSSLAAAINRAYELKNSNLENQHIINLVHQFTQLYECQRKISAAIPLKAQLFIVDEYERYLAEYNSGAKLCGYQSSAKLVTLRKQLRKVIRKNLKQKKQS